MHGFVCLLLIMFIGVPITMFLCILSLGLSFWLVDLGCKLVQILFNHTQNLIGPNRVLPSLKAMIDTISKDRLKVEKTKAAQKE